MTQSDLECVQHSVRQHQVTAPARVWTEACPAALLAFAPLPVPRPMPNLTLGHHKVDPLGGVDACTLALIDSELICGALQQRVSAAGVNWIAAGVSWIAAGVSWIAAGVSWELQRVSVGSCSGCQLDCSGCQLGVAAGVSWELQRVSIGLC